MKKLVMCTVLLTLAAGLMGQNQTPLTAQALLLPEATTTKLGISGVGDSVVVYVRGTTAEKSIRITVTSLAADGQTVLSRTEFTDCTCDSCTDTLRVLLLRLLPTEKTVKQVRLTEYTAARSVDVTTIPALTLP